jgi:Spy/CpxP family protein refolding chaperone
MRLVTMATRMSVLGGTLIFVATGLSGQQRGMPSEPPGADQSMGMGGMMQMMTQGMTGEGMMGPGMMEMMGQGMGMMATGGPGPAMILRMGDGLDLTEEQRTTLEAIQRRQMDAVQPLMAQAMEAHGTARAALEGDAPDLDAYARALRDGADRMVEAHVAMARAAADAREVLTEEQRQRLQGGMQMMEHMMGGGRSGMMGPGMPRP